MNKAKLKSYAPAARRDFIQAVTDRAHFFGLSEKEIVPVEESGDVAIIGGRPFPRAVAAQRRKLDARVKRDGFSQVMEAVAYTWFNRFLALRYMELHGYLEHGFRVLSNTGSSTTPEILDHAAQLDLPGLNKQKVTELKLDGDKDAELYRILLVAQCNALHSAMPFLFEKIEDETELLLPDNLLHSDSLIRKLVMEIEEEDWQEVEIIGWLYQFYISEKKDQVIGSVVKSEDIPAATQLFTPNWIVKYMVHNSLGRQWMATYPNSPLKSKMEFYIEPAMQTVEVIKQLTEITPDSLDPEKLSLLDPASGSGHILVEAYDIFKEIYLERGYSNRDFPRLILEKNLFGLDIDDRAAQMAGFALLMKARKDDRRILRSDNPVKLNVMAIQESGSIIIDNTLWGKTAHASQDLVDLFHHGKTFGSLIRVPAKLVSMLPDIESDLRQALTGGHLYASQAAYELIPLVEQAKILARKYDCVVANPPYMGSKGMNATLKNFVNTNFSISKGDLFAVFLERGFSWSGFSGYNALVTMQSWMFLSSFEEMRENLLANRTILTMAHLGARAFSEISGEVVQTTSFILQGKHIKSFRPTFFRLVDGQEEQKESNLKNGVNRFDNTLQDDFKKIPGSPIAYWVSNSIIDAFQNYKPIEEYSTFKQGIATSDNERFLRYWFEVDFTKSDLKCRNADELRKSDGKWFPYNKGGTYRKWYGNNDYLVNWENDGQEMKDFTATLPQGTWVRLKSREYYCLPNITYSALSSGEFGCRLSDPGFLFDTKGSCIFVDDENKLLELSSLLNSIVAQRFLKILCPTLDYSMVGVKKVPTIILSKTVVNAKKAKDISRKDWDSYELSWDFSKFPWIESSDINDSVEYSWANWMLYSAEQITRMQELETENNSLFIDAYGLREELAPGVPEDQITLGRADREADIKRLISYSIGCMMGRYSLDQAGLIYAKSGNNEFDLTLYETFHADDDGIVPVMDMDWFPDDAASRFEEFLKVAWSPKSFEENLKYVAESVSPKGGETPRETIRRYVSTQFYKDHLQTYKKRPIYWLFSSGKQRAFECLVYLHRYNESTLSRMRNEYVTPLQGKFSAQADYLSNEVSAASSTAERNRLQKQLDTLRKKQVELASFDDILRHYADQRISLDLDDGVKVNYGKFGSLLAEMKAVTGGTE